MQKIAHYLKGLNKNTILAVIAVVGVVVAGVLIYANSNQEFSLAGIFGTSGQKIAEKSVKYINDNGLAQQTVTLSGDVSEESGLVKFKIKVGDNEFDTYATKDGKLFFPQVFKMVDSDKTDKTADTNSGSGQTVEEIIASIKKTDKPALEAYVVSRCPFGLQMQRMMADAIKSIPELAGYMKVMYMGGISGDGKSITAMHGDAEAKENLRQICIREEQPNKYWSYTSCQMKSAGQEVACEKSTGVDSAKLSACISNPSKGVAYAKKDFDLSDKYGVTGSPTLILDESDVPEFTSDNKPVFGSSRSSDELKTIICTASKTAPSFCSTKLNTAQAATSFSATYASTAAASGNSGADGANCAPAQ